MTVRVSVDHLVGVADEGHRKFEAERVGRLQIVGERMPPRRIRN
jgi:hypothetical protein